MIKPSNRTRTRLVSLLVTAAVAALVAAVGIAPAAAEQGPATAQAAKKKCGKKGKKGAVAAKKCKKKKGGGGATGPSLPNGDWPCAGNGGVIYNSFQTLSGNGYTVNKTDPGTYSYNPATKRVTFQGGSWDWTYGIYSPEAESIQIYSNDPSVIPVGEYGWTCWRLSGSG